MLPLLSIAAERAAPEGCTSGDGLIFQKYWRNRISVAHQAAVAQSIVKFLAMHLSVRVSRAEREALLAAWDRSLARQP